MGAKMGQALAKKAKFMADRFFELFAVVFFITRLCCYGYVTWSAHFESIAYFPKGVPEWTCIVLLYILLALQMYWFGLVIKAVMKILMTGQLEDVRSDDEAEGEDVQKKADPKSKDTNGTE